MPFEFLPLETSNVFLLSALLFTAGLIEDVLDTWVTFTIVKRQTIATAIITFFGIVIEFTVFLSFISNLDKWPVIISYALGATVGTAGVIEYQKKVTRKKQQRQKQRKIKGAKRKGEAQAAAAKKVEKTRKVEAKDSGLSKRTVKKLEKTIKLVDKLVELEKKDKTNEAISSTIKSDTVKSPVQSPS